MSKLKHKEQRLLVLFDVQNMYYSAKNMYNAKVNFGEILKKAVSGRKLVKAIAYVIKADMKDESKFHDALEGLGIEVKMKGLQTFITGTKKGDWDIGIAMDAVRMAQKVDTVVLVSGDGDFGELLLYLKSHGCRTEVIAFSKTASRILKNEADDFCDLGKDLNKYLLKTDKKPATKYKKPYKKPYKKTEKQKKLTKTTKPKRPARSKHPRTSHRPRRPARPRTDHKPKPKVVQSLPDLNKRK